MGHYRSRLLLLIALLSLLGLASPAQAARASCVVSTPAQRLAWSSVVFRGRVIAVDPEPSSPGAVYFGPQRITFAVDRGWKGAVTPAMVVTNRLGSGDLNFERGREYLVYATGDSPASLDTNGCLGTQSSDAATDDLRFLGPGAAPEAPALPGLPNTGSGETASAPLGLLAGVGLIAATLIGVGHITRRRIGPRQG